MAQLDPNQVHILYQKTHIPDYRYKGDMPFSKWQASARARLGKLLCLGCIPFCEPSVEIVNRREEEDYLETKFNFLTEPGFSIAAHLLLPKGKQNPPVMICLQGHASGMHISLGRPKYPGDAEDIAEDRDYAIQAVKRGYAAFVMEQRGFGENGGDENGSQCRLPASAALLIGRTIIGERVHDVMCAVTLMKSGLFAVDGSRVAITGNSGGGTTSIYAAAMDERISLSMPCCAFTSFLASIGCSAHCFCNYIPGIARDFDMGDLCMLIAPRPVILIVAAKDPSFPLKEAQEQFVIVKQGYKALNAENQCLLLPAPEGHRYYAGIAWPAFDSLSGWK